MGKKNLTKELLEIYNSLFEAYGSQRWWPADEPFEVMVGAILTQSTAWTNVEKAIQNLKTAGALSPEALRDLDVGRLAELIRPSGYYNVKARKLKALVEWFSQSCNDDAGRMSAIETCGLRQELMAVWGVGEETADSIILYSAGQPVFVIDAYTRRIFERVGLSPAKAVGFQTLPYSEFQSIFMDNLPLDTQLFNEYHALLVCHGKNACRKKPVCGACCLRELCVYYSSNKTAVAIEPAISGP